MAFSETGELENRADWLTEQGLCPWYPLVVPVTRTKSRYGHYSALTLLPPENSAAIRMRIRPGIATTFSMMAFRKTGLAVHLIFRTAPSGKP
jgi:hypothetical protein